MMNKYTTALLVILSSLFNVASAQFTGGAIAGAVIGTFLGTLLLVGIILFLIWWCKYRKKPNGGTVENDETELQEVITEGKKHSLKDQPEPNGNVSVQREHTPDADDVFANGNVAPNDGSKIMTVALDDKPEPTNGFNIVPDEEGNIFIRDVRKGGPAEGKLMEGDIVTSVTVFYDGISHEDALNILSYSAPYKIAVSVVRGLNDTMPGDKKPDALVEELQETLVKRESKKIPNKVATPKEEVKEEPKPITEDKEENSSSSSSSDEETKPPEKTERKSSSSSSSKSEKSG